MGFHPSGGQFKGKHRKMVALPVIDVPSPFASTKDLQGFLEQWEGTPEAQTWNFLQAGLSRTREELARRGDKIVS